MVNKVPLFEKVCEGSVMKAAGTLLPTKSFLLDTGFDLHLWEGKKAEWRINESIIDVCGRFSSNLFFIYFSSSLL
jgi:hypothetical protein